MGRTVRNSWVVSTVFILGSLVLSVGKAEVDMSSMHSHALADEVAGHEHSLPHQSLHGLTTYQKLKDKLSKIQQIAKNPIQVGPLVKNGNNGGLIDIDVALNAGSLVNNDVCGMANPSPTVRQAVVCTINDGGRGNQDPNQIGFSTQGRELWGARLGNENGMKMLFITQQHGNEVQSTEAALKVIKYLAQSEKSYIKALLEKLNILFIVRANPDGGEPSRDCFIGTPLGAVIEEDCAMTRTNVDPQAGGGYREDSEADFFGTVGVGYNLNRYHFVDLRHPIRPVETQAMVATGLAWRPEVLLDLHGDVHKTSCEIDPASIAPGAILEVFPSAECKPESDQSEVVFSVFSSIANDDDGFQQKRSRVLASRLAHRVEMRGFGVVNRFAQIRTDAGVVNEGTFDAYAKIGAIAGGWESLNFVDAISSSIQRVVGGVPVPGVTPEWFLNDRFHRVINQQMNQVAIMEALAVVAGWTVTEPTDDGGYCDLPLTTAIKVAFPEHIFGPSQEYGPFRIPLIGGLQQVLDSCPNNP